MDAIKENEVPIKKTFLKSVFSFDTESKNEMMNIFQYALTAFVLVMILNKVFQTYIPEADETKHYTTLIFEMLIQLIGLFLGMIIIHRIITNIPTYSKVPYQPINMLSFIIPFLVILLSLQTKLGDKVTIIMDSLSYVWGKRSPLGTKGAGAAASAQPVTTGMVQQGMGSFQQQQQQQFNTNQLLPNPSMANTGIPDIQQQLDTGFGTNQGQGTAPSGLFPENDEPMAANAALGLSGSW